MFTIFAGEVFGSRSSYVRYGYSAKNRPLECGEVGPLYRDGHEAVRYLAEVHLA